MQIGIIFLENNSSFVNQVMQRMQFGNAKWWREGAGGKTKGENIGDGV